MSRANKTISRKERLVQALEASCGNVLKACAVAETNRVTFYHYLKTDAVFKSKVEALRYNIELQANTQLISSVYEDQRYASHPIAPTDAIKKLGNARHNYTLSERDFEDEVVANIERIAHDSGWGDIRKVERQYVLPITGRRYAKIDIMVWHNDGTGTAIECKLTNASSNYELTSIGQLMLYASTIKAQLGYYPRIVMCAPSISPVYYRIIKEFHLPIHLLQIDKDECLYLS